MKKTEVTQGEIIAITDFYYKDCRIRISKPLAFIPNEGMTIDTMKVAYASYDSITNVVTAGMEVPEMSDRDMLLLLKVLTTMGGYKMIISPANENCGNGQIEDVEAEIKFMLSSEEEMKEMDANVIMNEPASDLIERATLIRKADKLRKHSPGKPPKPFSRF